MKPDNNPSNQSGGTFGEKMFDVAVYGGLGYLANAALSVAVTFVAMEKPGSFLNKGMKAAQPQLETLMKQFTSDPAKITRWADFSNRTIFLSSGGYILLLPMKWLEDNKKSLTLSIDHLFGTGPQTPEAKKEFDEHFENQPKQSYTSLIGGRLLAHPMIVMAAAPIMVKMKGSEKLSEFLEKNWGKTFEQFEKPKVIRDLTSEEIILSGTAAAIGYVCSKGLASILNTPTLTQEPIQKPTPTVFQVAERKPLREAPTLQAQL